MRQLIYSFSIVLLVQVGVSQAVTVHQLNQVTVPVADQSSGVLQEGMQQAFKLVLVKLSGNSNVMTLPGVADVASHPGRWVQSYHYNKVSDQTAHLDQQNQPSVTLSVVFDREGLVKLLHGVGQKVWSSSRPLTLFYLNSNVNRWQPMLSDISKQRGVPVIFPVMDLADQSVLLSENTTANNDCLSEAATQSIVHRYEVQSVLYGQLVQADNEWKVSGCYYLNGQSTQWAVHATTEKSAVVKVMNTLTQMMVSQLVTSEQNSLPSRVRIDVVGIDNIADYAKVMHYLRGMGEVKSIKLHAVSPSALLLSVQLKGDIAHFQRQLSEGGQLKPVEKSLQANQHQADLYYFY